MEQSLEEGVLDWTITTWFFLHTGILPNEDEKPYYAVKAEKWGESNRAIVERFADIHVRRNIILLARTHTPQALAATQVADLHSIQTPTDRAAIAELLYGDAEYRRLKREGGGWASNPSYTGVRWAYYLFWPIGFVMHKIKERSHKAFLQAQHLEYVAADTYFRRLDADADYIQQLEFLLNGYWSKSEQVD